ncbi:hypothetical protein LY78DRAFT_363050 [Colletotrichum sublineola]|nr:hypothetical protein LY78DRAFT_363050 [Colletotrichum sublineola]
MASRRLLRVLGRPLLTCLVRRNRAYCLAQQVKVPCNDYPPCPDSGCPSVHVRTRAHLPFRETGSGGVLLTEPRTSGCGAYPGGNGRKKEQNLGQTEDGRCCKLQSSREWIFRRSAASRMVVRIHAQQQEEELRGACYGLAIDRIIPGRPLFKSLSFCPTTQIWRLRQTRLFPWPCLVFGIVAVSAR